MTDVNIRIPSFHHFGFGFNDRMALATPRVAAVYAGLWDVLLPYSKVRSIHSEMINKWHLERVLPGAEIESVDFFFNRVRANGDECPDATEEARRGARPTEEATEARRASEVEKEVVESVEEAAGE